jgi:hypothetical protein
MTHFSFCGTVCGTLAAKFLLFHFLIFIAANGLALADVPAIAFRQPKFIDKVA